MFEIKNSFSGRTNCELIKIFISQLQEQQNLQKLHSVTIEIVDKNYIVDHLPFFACFLADPNCPVTSWSLFSNSCFFSAICSSLDLPETFLSKQIQIF